MNTVDEIKIESLQNELTKAQESVTKYHCEIERLVKDLTHYESGTKRRNEELAEMVNKMESLKNSIPDFNQETYEAYIQYHDVKEEYKKTSKFYSEIDQRIEKMRKELSSKRDDIAYMEQQIHNIKELLIKVKSENE